MPEIKNTFLAGKMNKSLDNRIIPQGEYRDALNVQVTKADGPDVGVIHNIKGNTIVASLGLDTGYEVIGSFFDEKNNIIYWFVTDNNHSYIYKFDKKIHDDPNNPTNPTSLIVSSSSPDNWLNFNKEYKITGVNLLEDLLFWTDGLNQPRRINVERADGSYYNSEVKVSVAKYAPYLPPQITSTTPSDFYDENITSKRIEEEFVRFAYRYKYTDGTYSLISPFTPILFKMGSNLISTQSNYYEDGQLMEVASSTEVDFMVNNINKITMNIDLPTGSNGAKEDYEIEKIEVLYKESDSPAIRIVDTLTVSDSDTSGVKQYVYKSTNFKSTLPENQLTRVFDNVPLTAVAQEIAGNRVVYGNISFKKELPTINYSVISSEKSIELKDSADTNIYTHHSLKQRRSYEVGIILSDLFGRTSPVITSENSTIYVQPKDKFFNNTGFNGDSIKVIFDSVEDDNNTLYDADENPTGWYSYKIVVKQKDQEYYNVYTPGVWNYGAPKSYFVIHADNVNKVPRDTTSYSDNDNFAPSAIRLYPKVLNVRSEFNTTADYLNQISGLLDVSDIGNLNDHSLLNVTKLYEDEKNHLIGKIDKALGTEYIYLKNEGDFAVFETEPFESALDIYYETAESGLITEILGDGVNFADFSLSKTSNTKSASNFSESFVEGTVVANIYPLDNNGNEIPSSLVTFSIASQYVADRYDIRFNSSKARWEIYLKNGFAVAMDSYGPYTIQVNGNGLGGNFTHAIVFYETNALPLISSSVNNLTFDISDYTPSSTVTEDNTLFRVYASNGSGDVVENKSGLTVSITYIENITDNSGVNDLSTYQAYVDIHKQADGVYQVYYKADISLVITGTKEFLFKFEVEETIYDNSTGQTVTETNEVSVSLNMSNNVVVDSSTAMSGQLYYASPTTFDNAYDACQDPVGGINWTSKTVYWDSTVTTDPFVVASQSVSPSRMYNNRTLSIPATSGWYKRTDTGVIGYYQITGNEPETFTGWYYNTPEYCASLTEEEAVNNKTYSPPSDTSDDTTEDNPYDTAGDVDDRNIP